MFTYLITVIFDCGTESRPCSKLGASMVDAFERFLSDCCQEDGDTLYFLVKDPRFKIKYISIDPQRYPSYISGKRYAGGTTLDVIIAEGWARGFKIEQTYQEVMHQGIPVSKDYIWEEWDRLDEEYFSVYDKLID